MERAETLHRIEPSQHGERGKDVHEPSGKMQKSHGRAKHETMELKERVQMYGTLATKSQRWRRSLYSRHPVPVETVAAVAEVQTGCWQLYWR